MTATEHLSKIRAKCVELLEIASKRTPGKWQADAEQGVYNSSVRCGPSEPWTGDCVASVLKQTDARFVASCAGPAEAGWRATIAAIDAIERDGAGDTLEAKTILAAWPEELL